MQEGCSKPALVVFDLGGTTVHDRGEVPAAYPPPCARRE
jgi:hypothetical protein